MPEPLKNLYNKMLVSNVGIEIIKHYPDFNHKAFNRDVFDNNWKDKELKQRMRHIAECLHQHLPNNYKKSINILKSVSVQFGGFEYMFFQDYVECYGMDDFKPSIAALEHFTKYASSEFAVRAFIIQDEKRIMQQMQLWADSENHHVRRLATEGCRPRLPWAVALPAFKRNPQAVLKILRKLKNDESEYVRRSVANNLNDISKDNPDLVLDIAQKWLDNNAATNWVIKHACRSLLKQGHKKTLSLFGYTNPKHIKIGLFKVQNEVATGKKLMFSFQLKTTAARLGKCRLEFAISFVKANGSLSRKVFKISEADIGDGEKQIEKYFSFKKISTRKYYPGTHTLTVIINGVDFITKSFELTR